MPVQTTLLSEVALNSDFSKIEGTLKDLPKARETQQPISSYLEIPRSNTDDRKGSRSNEEDTRSSYK